MLEPASGHAQSALAAVKAPMMCLEVEIASSMRDDSQLRPDGVSMPKCMGWGADKHHTSSCEPGQTWLLPLDEKAAFNQSPML